LKKFIVNNIFEKGVKLQGLNSFENMVKLEKIESIMINLHKSKVNDQNKKDTEIQCGYWSSIKIKLHKIKVWG